MLKKKDKKDKIAIYIILLFILIVILIILTVILSLKEEKDETNEYTIGQIDIENNDEIIKMLQDMNERERMEYYFNVFFEYVENENYEKAYELLNDSFKENYFQTCEQFSEYCKKTFTDMMNISQENIERNGDVYVLWISVSDIINGTKDDQKEITVVIKENDFYDFELSFSII